MRDDVQCPGCDEPIAVDARECPGCGLRVIASDFPKSDWERLPQGDMVGEVDVIEALDDAGRLPTEDATLAFGDRTTVFHGTLAEATALRASLGACGVVAYIRDENAKTIDPFITGGNVFMVGLDVPTEQAEAVREFLARNKAERPAPTPEEVERARVERMGQQVILSTILFLTAPAGIVLLVRYLRAAAKLETPPPDRTTVIACGLFSLLETAILAWLAITLARL